MTIQSSQYTYRCIRANEKTEDTNYVYPPDSIIIMNDSRPRGEPSHCSPFPHFPRTASGNSVRLIYKRTAKRDIVLEKSAFVLTTSGLELGSSLGRILANLPRSTCVHSTFDIVRMFVRMINKVGKTGAASTDMAPKSLFVLHECVT
jgi:hypothetical protein